VTSVFALLPMDSERAPTNSSHHYERRAAWGVRSFFGNDSVCRAGNGSIRRERQDHVSVFGGALSAVCSREPPDPRAVLAIPEVGGCITMMNGGRLRRA